MRVGYAGFRPSRARSRQRQEAGTRRVAFPRRLKDSLPQSLYLPLAVRPVDPVPIDRCPGSVSGGRSSGPFTISAPNLSFGSSGVADSSSKAHLPTWARFRARARGPVSGQLYEPTSGGLIDLVRFRVAFRPPALASWASCTRRGLGPSLPPAYRHPTSEWRTPTGFPCSTRMRHDWGWVPSIPRGRWCPHGRARSLAAICRLPTARPLSSRRSAPSRDVWLTRHQRGFTGIHPMPSLPLACGPRTERALLGFSMSFAPDRRWQRRSRTSWRGQVSDTDPGYVFSIG